MLYGRILILDNDRSASLITQRGLERAGATSVTTVTLPDAAWRHALAHGLDLIIIDPGPIEQAAIGLLRALKVRYPHLPIIVLTAYDTPRLRQAMRKLNVNAYLAKPTELPMVASAVNSALQSYPMV